MALRGISIRKKMSHERPPPAIFKIRWGHAAFNCGSPGLRGRGTGQLGGRELGEETACRVTDRIPMRQQEAAEGTACARINPEFK